MMADLQDVDRAQTATRDESGFDRCLGVSGHQGGELTERELQHDRSVVDVALGEGCRYIGL